MKRIDIYKKQLDEVFEEEKSNQKRIMVFQELMNSLNTYSEKKELADHFEDLDKLVLN